jgi:hypothetical protein
MGCSALIGTQTHLTAYTARPMFTVLVRGTAFFERRLDGNRSERVTSDNRVTGSSPAACNMVLDFRPNNNRIFCGSCWQLARLLVPKRIEGGYVSNDIIDKERRRLVRDVHMRMASYVHPYLASISKTDDGLNGIAHGSGLYLQLRDEIGLLTAEHLLSNEVGTGFSLTHLLKANDYYRKFENPWIGDPFPVDLAVTYINSETWSQGDRHALSPTHISKTHDVAAHELLFLCGYPGKTAYFSRFGDAPTLHSPAIPYSAHETALPSGFNTETHFALKYEMKLSESASGSTEELPEPGGFSGSPIWNSGFVASNCSKDWAPEQARMIGIVTHWKMEDSCVIAVKAAKVREFLLAQVRIRVASDRWIKRGDKSADFQVDLDYAAQLVPDLS